MRTGHKSRGACQSDDLALNDTFAFLRKYFLKMVIYDRISIAGLKLHHVAIGLRCMYVRNRSRFYGLNRLTFIGGYIYAVVVFVHIQNRIDTASAKRCYDPVIHRVNP